MIRELTRADQNYVLRKFKKRKGRKNKIEGLACPAGPKWIASTGGEGEKEGGEKSIPRSGTGLLLDMQTSEEGR